MVIKLVDEAKNKLNLQDYEQQIKEIVSHYAFVADSVERDQVSIANADGEKYVKESFFHEIVKRLLKIDGIGKHALTYTYKGSDGIEISQEVLFVYQR